VSLFAGTSGVSDQAPERGNANRCRVGPIFTAQEAFMRTTVPSLFTPLLATALALSTLTVARHAQAQTADLNEQVNTLRYAAAPVSKLVVAAANIKVGVSLERLTLISGEGHQDKKLTAGLLAGATTLLSARMGLGRGTVVDFADREPIDEHLTKDDAQKISSEALAILVAKLQAAGVDVVGPEAVVAAPFYASVRGEPAVTFDFLSQDGGLFKKSYHYGFHRMPVAGLKFRDKPSVTNIFSDDDWFTQARAAAAASGALEFNISFFNDKKVFGLFDLSMRVLGPINGRNTDSILLMQVLKNVDDFQVPSGGKDAYAYWGQLKPKFETVAAALADRVAKALPASQKQ
jgi:hypothetical protein